MPSISDLLSRATTNQSDVTQFMELSLDLEKIIRILQLRVTSDPVHVVCGVIYLHHAERLRKETTQRLEQISSELNELTTSKLEEHEYNRRAISFLFTVVEISPMISLLNVSFEETILLRRLANEISKLQLRNPDFFIHLLEALQIKEICSELLATRAHATAQLNHFNAPPRKPPPKPSSLSEFVNIPTPHSGVWDDDISDEVAPSYHPT